MESQGVVATEYTLATDTDLFDNPGSQSAENLATQAAAGRKFVVIHTDESNWLKIRLCEDLYEAWMPAGVIFSEGVTNIVNESYLAKEVSEAEIATRVIPHVLQLVHTAAAQTNVYKWGGTLGPNFDCSGLMQWAFSSAGVWIPRDAFQQHHFTDPVGRHEAQPGDLVFFGAHERRIDHVGIIVENVQGCADLKYVHSSGIKHGRNGIGTDELRVDQEDPIGEHYAKRFISIGRVTKSFCGWEGDAPTR